MNEEELRNQITELIRDEIQETINDYIDEKEEQSTSGLGFVPVSYTHLTLPTNREV